MKRISRFVDTARKSLQLCLLGVAVVYAPAHAEESGFDLTLSRAIELHEAGSADAALQIYRSLREDRPRDPHLLYEFARSLRATGDLGGCIDQTAASAAVPSAWQAKALGLRARCEQESGAFDRALESYQSAVQRFPGNARLQFDYALALEQQGSSVAALSALKAAFALADQEPTLYLDYAAWLSARQDAAGVLLMSLRYIMAAPHSPQAAGAAEQVQALLDGERAQGKTAPSPFLAAYELVRGSSREEPSGGSAADRLSLVLQRFVLESVGTAGPAQRDSVLWAATIEPLLSLAEHDVLDAYLYFVAALARTEGSPEWLSAHRDKFERLVEYLARAGRTS